MQNNFFLAFLLTVLAGLSTAVGALLVFWVKTSCTKFLSFGLGLSAGVMIYLSFFELLKEANHLLLGNVQSGYRWLVIFMFLCGLALAAIIDALTHQQIGACPNLDCQVPNTGGRRDKTPCKHEILFKAGLFTAIVIAIHNFPEGIATFTTASVNLVLGVPIAIAIAIHNIPEL